MLKKLLLLVATGFFLASCAATKTEQGGDADADSSASSSSSEGSINAGTQEDLIVNVGVKGLQLFCLGFSQNRRKVI
jgi:uncharacterized lipoprotein YajG